MKGFKLSLAFVTFFSVFLIVYFNSFSVAQKTTDNELRVESEVYKQLEENDYVNVIVKLSHDSSSEDIDRIVKNSKANIKQLSEEISDKLGKIEIIYNYEAFNSLAVRANKDTIEALKQSDFVQEIFAERMLEIQYQQSMPLINATQAWNYPITTTTNLTGLGSTVCLLDTGVDYTRSALGGAWGVKVIGGYDFVNLDTDPTDDNGHGTHLAGIIAGNGWLNTTTLFRGVAPDAMLVSEKVCDQNGFCSNTDMLAGMNHCLTTISPRKLSVISVSIGDGGSYSNISNTCPTWMDAAISSAVSKGVPVVVSSGNQGHKNGISYPACSPNATSVGATYDFNSTPLSFGWLGVCSEVTAVDKIACASNTGNNLDLVAPGSKITSLTSSVGTVCGAGNGNLVFPCSGTSQAAAHVSGAVALIKQKYNSNIRPNYSSALRIKKLLLRSLILSADGANGLAFPRLSLQYLI